MARVSDTDVKLVGKEIFERMKGQTPSVFNKDWWSGKVMDISMKDEAFKVEMFRFVDVFPTLRNHVQVAEHLQEYFCRPETNFPAAFTWGLNKVKPSVQNRFNVVLHINGFRDSPKVIAVGVNSTDTDISTADNLGPSVQIVWKIAARLDGIERSIMALVEAHGREAASIREQMARLVEENRSLRLRLEPPPPEPARQVKAWSPEPAPDPADGMPWWRVAWLSLVAPERLRRCDS